MTDNVDFKVSKLMLKAWDKEIQTLKDENEQLKAQIVFLQNKLDIKERVLTGCKLNNSSLTTERNQLQAELDSIKSMSMFEFGNTYCSDESLEADGKLFAHSLLGHTMTDEEVAIDEAENSYVPYTAEDF